jgi:hypothetical protein
VTIVSVKPVLVSKAVIDYKNENTAAENKILRGPIKKADTSYKSLYTAGRCYQMRRGFLALGVFWVIL